MLCRYVASFCAAVCFIAVSHESLTFCALGSIPINNIIIGGL